MSKDVSHFDINAHFQTAHDSEGFICKISSQDTNQDFDLIRRSVCRDLKITKHEDGFHYCLLHLPTKNKNVVEFTTLIDIRIAETEHNIAKKKAIISAHIDKVNRTETQYDFRHVWFPSEVNFYGYEFKGHADFSGAAFSENANFKSTLFSEEADFSEATFYKNAEFDNAKFHEQANLYSVRFRDTFSFKQASFFQWLNLAETYFADYSFLQDVACLTQLSLMDNGLTDLAFLIDVYPPEEIWLGQNPLIYPPIEIAKLGIEAIRDYFAQISKQGVDYIYEAKMLIVGEPESGKTTLFRKLQNNNYIPRDLSDEEKASTLGVDILKGWEFPYVKDENIAFKANLWDFGGQPPQYILHQYFLTERALYILLANKRDENPSTFNYWFEMIGTLGKGCPVLVVLNEKNYKSVSKFDLSKYEREFPYINIEKNDVDFADDDGRFQKLQSDIQIKLSNLPHIGDKLPASWKKIRESLEDIQGQNRISIDEYFDICRNNDLTEEESQLNALRYFRDVGIALYYENDMHLCNYVILNPHWVIDSLYSVLENDSIQKNNGKFSRNFIYILWKKKQHNNADCEILLNLMLKGSFEIAYPINKSEYIVPFLLPYETPDYDLNFNQEGVVQIHFQYNYMPPGILSRLIVQLNEEIYKEDGHDKVWQDGGLFRQEDNFAEVIELEHQERMTIKVFGDNPRRFLTYIRNKVLDIHKQWFKGRLNVQEMVPCICEECKNNERPYFHKLSDLERKFLKQKPAICNKSDEEVNVRKLLEGVYIEDKSKAFDLKQLGFVIARNITNIVGDESVVVQDSYGSTINIHSNNQFSTLLDRIESDSSAKQMVEFNKIGDRLISLLEKHRDQLDSFQIEKLDTVKMSDSWKAKIKFGLPLSGITGLGVDFEKEYKVEKNIEPEHFLTKLRGLLYGEELQSGILKS